MAGRNDGHDLLDLLSNPGPLISAAMGATPGTTGGPQPNSEPLGAETGAPPDTRFYRMQVSSGSGPTMIVPGERASRVITLIAPGVGFSIFVGDAGVSTLTGMRLTPLLPYDAVIKGRQEIYAVTDSPISLSLDVQIAPILIGDRERRL